MAIAYVTIELETHTYKATLHNVADLERHLSNEVRPFAVGDVEIIDYAYAHTLANVLNRIARYGQYDKSIAKLRANP